MTDPEHVQTAWDEYRLAMAELRDPDFTRIPGLTRAEELEALRLFASTYQVELIGRERNVAMMAYLAVHAPGARSVENAIERLSPEQLQDFNRIATGEAEQ